MKKLLTTLMAILGLSANAQQQSKIMNIDPKTVLFSVPTLSNDFAPLEPVSMKPSERDLVFHEDDWSQVEFFPKSRLGEIQQMLREFKIFEAKHRVQYGWRDVYARKIKRLPIFAGNYSAEQLAKLVGGTIGTPPTLFASNTIMGKVKNGFTISLGGNVSLYGVVESNNVPVFGAIVGPNSDSSKLTDAFMKLSKNKELILVDWRAMLVLVSVTPEGKLDAWKP